MWKSKRTKVILISTFIAMVISTLYILSLISDEVELCKLEATSVLDNQIASIKNEFMVNINSVYELRALIFGANGKYVDPQIIGERILKNPNIRNILYAPDSVVSNVYPLENNESIIGLNFIKS